MALIERVQSILLKPKQTWPEIAAEGGDTASIFTGYVMILAAIPAVAGFIGLTLVGVGGMGVSYRLPILSGVVQMIVSYLLTLAMVFVLALIVNGLAPTFGGTKDPLRALKLVAYGTTASFLGGIFNLIPALALLGVLASLYSIYLIYTGIAVMMRCPPDKAGGLHRGGHRLRHRRQRRHRRRRLAGDARPGRRPDRHRHRHGRLAPARRRATSRSRRPTAPA